jgi:hypothetical protein
MLPALHERRSRRTLYWVLLIITLLTLLLGGVYIVVAVNYGVDDGYALWGAAEMVIDYMEIHDGDWPRNWEDLRPQFNASNGNVPGWTFEEYQSRIAIDFNADPDELYRKSLESPHPTFRVIWPKWELLVRVGGDPNQRLYNYFRRKGKRDESEEGNNGTF